MKKYHKKTKRKKNTDILTKEQLVEIHAEAYYRALKRIEEEQRDKRINSDKKEKKYQKGDVLFYINVILWPWKINKRFNVNQHIYNNILSVIISLVLKIFGFYLWLSGIITVVYKSIQMMFTISFASGIVHLLIGFALLLWGSIFVMAGKEFEKERDGNTIYAYSASILALISCILGIVALLN